MGEAIKMNGHYYIPIPFRGEQTLPNNKPLAKKKLENLGKKAGEEPRLEEGLLRGHADPDRKGAC